MKPITPIKSGGRYQTGFMLTATGSNDAVQLDDSPKPDLRFKHKG